MHDPYPMIPATPVYPPGGTPAQPAPAPAGRLVMRYGQLFCKICDLNAQYCKGHTAPDATTAQDGGAAASLDRRVRECQGR